MKDFKHFLNVYGMLLILFALVFVLSLKIPNFMSASNMLSIMEQVSMFGIISLGVTFAIITGGIDLSSGSVVALAGVIAASIVSVPDSGVFAAFMGFCAAIAVGALCGVISGSFTAIGKIPPFIATLGMMTIARGVAQLVAKGRPIDASADAFTAAADSFNLFGYKVSGLVLIYIAVVVGSHILLSATQFGRHVYAIGGNRNAARLAGINVRKTLVLVYTFAGALAGLAGAMLAARTYAGNPSYGLAWELDAIAAAVIGGVSLAGGVGTVPMCVIGALIIGTTNKGLNLMGVDPNWQLIVKGGIIILAVLIDTLKRRRG